MSDTFETLANDLRKRALALVESIDNMQDDPIVRLATVKANHKSIGYLASTSQRIVDLQTKIVAALALRPKNIGLFVGSAVADIATFAALLERPPDFLMCFCGNATRADYLGAGRYQGLLYQAAFPVGRRVWTVMPYVVDPQDKTGPNSGTIQKWAAGDYRDLHVALAADLVKYDPAPADDPNRPIYVRLAHECNGSWYTWSASGGHHEAFKAGFRGQVAAMRSVAGGQRLQFEWNVNVGQEWVMADPALAYPGDDVVATVGMDVYSTIRYDYPDPIKQWEFTKTRGVGLDWLERFTAAHKKPIGFCEWGVEQVNYAPYITAFAAWIKAHNVTYHNYWFSNSGVAGKTGLAGATAAAYLTAFK